MDPSILSKFIVFTKKSVILIFWHKITEAISAHTIFVSFRETQTHPQTFREYFKY